jgi:hypothetical protein
MKLLAVFFPWFVFFLREKYTPGFICLVLQISIIGWPIASVWCLVSLLIAGKSGKENSLLYYSRPSLKQFNKDAA